MHCSGSMFIIALLFGLDICGINSIRVKRIIGGADIEFMKAPYMLSMRFRGKHICGAVIIGEKWGLTAAHCCIAHTKKQLPEVTMRSGSASLLEGGTIHKVTRVMRHELYQDDDDDYDLCAIRVNPNFGNDTKPVILPSPGVPFDIDWGIVSGWGLTKMDGKELSPVLQSIKVTRVDLQRCKYAYRNSYIIHDSDVCYGSGNSSKDACQGDSGGPLVNKNSILIGIVSFGNDCGYSNLPGIYTNITLFRNWIKRKTSL